jgi:hypothetical protein
VRLFLIFSAISAFSLGLRALNVKFRNVRYVIPFVIQFGGQWRYGCDLL